MPIEVKHLGEFSALIKQYVDREVGRVQAKLDDVIRRIDGAEFQIEDLERDVDDAMRFTGDFDGKKIYEPGDVCMNHGVMWYCLKRVRGYQPGNSRNWRNLTKHNTIPRSDRSW